MKTGLYLPGKALTVLSPQVSGSSLSIYSGANVEGDRAHAKIYCISSHLLFWDREEPEGYPQSPRSPKTFKAPSPLPHNSDSILNPLMLDDLIKVCNSPTEKLSQYADALKSIQARFSKNMGQQTSLDTVWVIC